jgi:hypothetical protein
MSDELARKFASLGADADRTPMMAAPALRTRADRRAASRIGLAVVGVVALVAVTAFGARLGSTGPAPAAVSPAAVNPAAIPLGAFLSKADLNDATGLVPPTEARPPLPALCGTRFSSDDQITARRTLRAPYRGARTGVVRQTITVYAPGGAQTFMAELRTAVAGCATEPERAGDYLVTHRAVSAVDAGDEAIRIEEQFQRAGAAASAPTTQAISVVRVGDVVTVVWTGGYADDSVVTADVDAMTRAAQRHLREWRTTR